MGPVSYVVDVGVIMGSSGFPIRVVGFTSDAVVRRTPVASFHGNHPTELWVERICIFGVTELMSWVC